MPNAPTQTARLVQSEDEPAVPDRDQRDSGREHADRRRDQDRRHQDPHEEQRRPVEHVFWAPRVVADEAIARRAQLQRDRGNEHQADEDVQREQRAQREQRHALDREQHEPGRGGQARVALKAALQKRRSPPQYPTCHRLSSARLHERKMRARASLTPAQSSVHHPVMFARQA